MNLYDFSFEQLSERGTLLVVCSPKARVSCSLTVICSVILEIQAIKNRKFSVLQM